MSRGHSQPIMCGKKGLREGEHGEAIVVFSDR